MKPFVPRYVRMKPLKELVRGGKLKILHMSDDGEYIHYKVLPNGPTCGEWMQFGERLMVVDRETVHENQVLMKPDFYEEVENVQHESQGKLEK